jgi:hypothetical protein
MACIIVLSGLKKVQKIIRVKKGISPFDPLMYWVSLLFPCCPKPSIRGPSSPCVFSLSRLFCRVVLMTWTPRRGRAHLSAAPHLSSLCFPLAILSHISPLFRWPSGGTGKQAAGGCRSQGGLPCSCCSSSEAHPPPRHRRRATGAGSGSVAHSRRRRGRAAAEEECCHRRPPCSSWKRRR